MPLSSIIDNQGENTLHHALHQISANGHELWIATAFFSLDALNLMGDKLNQFQKVRLIFGGDAAPSQRNKLLQAMRERSEADLVKQREQDPLLTGLTFASKLIEEGRLEARVYTRDKFHAKAYLAHCTGHPPLNGILGSGNFTRPGLTQNIELNVHLTIDQTVQLKDWFEDVWKASEADKITADLLQEVRRQIDLYAPYAIYQKALIAWGNHYQGGIDGDTRLALTAELDPHQMLGYRRALEILERENGVMICDGVGLGKSFIALALMEHFCQQKKNVLLIAPKSIMDSSWKHYLGRYLDDYRQPYGTIFEKYMTDFGFDPEDTERDSEKFEAKLKEFRKLVDRVDVVVVDESHNFRTTNVQRYKNLKELVKEVSADSDERKRVILLTATPINTKYHDLSAQLALIAQERGNIAGFPASRITSAAKDLDKKEKRGEPNPGQMAFDIFDPTADVILRKVLESTVIQRKRSTCIQLAEAAGKSLVFPIRNAPETPTYELSEHWKEVIHTSRRHFEPIAVALQKMKVEYKKAEDAGIQLTPFKLPNKSDGIRFAAFLPEQYRLTGEITRKEYQSEVFLAGLVFTSIMKQLESSPAAFQGILQSLGLSLVSRLKFVLGEDADKDIEPHSGWIRTEINALAYDDNETDFAEGEDADLNGEELDTWLEKAMTSRKLKRKLAEFKAPIFDVVRWRKDILHDLALLREIHRETLIARQNVDFKLEIVAKMLQERVSKGERVVVFTQSQRTSFYLEKQLIAKMPEAGIARIDSNVEQKTREDILHAFCPNYNPAPKNRKRERVDVLICTDVLSEGVNMQEAHCILNYDIHWNPVRLIQRIGRVDRRLDPVKTPEVHAFSIINFLPPSEINDIIKLVNTVENRTSQINRTLGIDQAFFKATDPADTLKEFNKLVDGEPTLLDKANERYVATLANPDPDIAKIVEHLPLGAFGVWEGAPMNGVFALYEMQGTDKITKKDADQFKGILGTPVLALQHEQGFTTDAARILNILGETVKGQKSADPSDAESLKATLKTMKSKVNQSFRDVNLVATIQPKLICWMELRKDAP